MKAYRVCKAFVDYGIYHGIGDVITNTTLVNSLAVKINDGILTPFEVKGPQDLAAPIVEAKKPEEPKKPVQPKKPAMTAKEKAAAALAEAKAAKIINGTK